jgi:hypothetical protein
MRRLLALVRLIDELTYPAMPFAGRWHRRQMQLALLLVVVLVPVALAVQLVRWLWP